MREYKMKEIKLWGRGGQGAVIAAEMLAAALATDGKWVAAFPSFGPERRGAPVDAFIRFDDKPITTVSEIKAPDCLMVLDRVRAVSTPVDPEIKPDGILIMNVAMDVEPKAYQGISVLGRVDGTKIGMEEIGRDISNSVMLGAFAKTTGWISEEPLLECLEEHFAGKLLKVNQQCLKRGFQETVVTQHQGDK